jgi:hypothetical protein
MFGSSQQNAETLDDHYGVEALTGTCMFEFLWLIIMDKMLASVCREAIFDQDRSLKRAVRGSIPVPFHLRRA